MDAIGFARNILKKGTKVAAEGVFFAFPRRQAIPWTSDTKAFANLDF